MVTHAPPPRHSASECGTEHSWTAASAQGRQISVTDWRNLLNLHDVGSPLALIGSEHGVCGRSAGGWSLVISTVIR
jgi:hypothetical protein